MPELPEVETIANGLHARVQCVRIVRVWTSGKPQTFKSPESEISETLTGATIKSVRRVGKTVVMTVTHTRTKDSVEFLIHLGMTGRLLVSAPDVPLPPHTHAVLTLADGREIRFVDPRRFGRLSIHAGDVPHATESGGPAGYAGPGSEPLTILLEDFIALFRGRKTPIKAALLNQSLLHGVGNIYADEALFRAGVRPRRQAARLTSEEFARLRIALQTVLKRAIKLGGSSVSDYVDAEGMRGYFQIEHKVYGHRGDPCTVCGTPITKIVVAGRGTHFCPHCQR